MKKRFLLPISLLCLFFGSVLTLQAQEPCFDEDYVQNPFGIVAPDNLSTLVKLVDIDHDSILEVFVSIEGSGPNKIHYYENASSNSNPVFVFQEADPFGLDSALPGRRPWQFVDIDGDGLHEIFIGHFDDEAPITMIENTGNATMPNFGGEPIPNPHGITLPMNNLGQVLDNAFPAFVDIDNDGDQDVFITGRFINSLPDEGLFFMRNNDPSGTGTSPQFDSIEKNPFGFDFALSENARVALFADLDCDGDYDMYMNTIPSNIDYYFENKGTAEVANFSVGGQDPTSMHSDPFSAAGGDFLDVGGDGDLDLLNGSLKAGVQYYENVSSDTTQFCHCTTINVKENFLNVSLTISPNPVQNILHLNISSEILLKNLTIRIHDLLGRQVLERYPSDVGYELSETLNVSHLRPGIYFLEVNMDGKIKSAKILKTR